MAYDWKAVAEMDDLSQRAAIAYAEARPGSEERAFNAAVVSFLKRAMDRYIATHSAADGSDPR